MPRLHCGLGAFLGWWGWQGGAVEAFRDAVRNEPDYAEAHYRLGEALSRQGRWREAAHAFGHTVRLHSSNLEAHGNLVLSLARAGLGGRAVAALERMIRLRPQAAEPQILLGALQRRLRRQDEAIRTFRWAVRLGPAPPWSRFFLGEAVLGAVAWKAALETYQMAQGLSHQRPDPGLGRSCLNDHPGQPVLDPVSASRRPRRSGRLAALSRPLPIGALSSGLASRLGRAATFVKGELLIIIGRLPFRRPHRAIRSLRQGLAIRSESGSRRGRTRLAWTLLLPFLVGSPLRAAQGETPQAREAARQCTAQLGEAKLAPCRRALDLGLSPKRAAVVLGVMARQLADLERWDDVVETYQELVRLRPEDPDARLRLGRALLAGQHRAEEAIPILEEAVRLGAGADAHGALGSALNLLERHTEALAAFDQAVALDPRFLENRPATRHIRDASERGERWPPGGAP